MLKNILNQAVRISFNINLDLNSTNLIFLKAPEYNSSIFLDCCGLVRRVMRDLEKDFGFRIGGGNQAYMFDTLPKIIHDLKDVKPGDLVFISGIYNNPNSKYI